MTPAIFFALLIVPIAAIAAITISICRNISGAAEDAQEIFRNRSETRRNYARAQEDR